MTSPHDRSDAHLTSAPEPAELEFSDSLIATIVADRPVIPTQPLVELLRATRGPATSEELLDPVGFARQVAAASASRHTGGQVTSDRFRLVRRALAAKAALITGIAVLGVAGAGAATGVAILTAPDTPRPAPVETSIATPATSATQPDGSAGSASGPKSGSALDRTWPSVSIAPVAQRCVTDTSGAPCTDPPAAAAPAAPAAGTQAAGESDSPAPNGGNAGDGAADPAPNANPNASEGSDNSADGSANANPNAGQGSDNSADGSANANPNAGNPGTNGNGAGNSAGNSAGNGAINANPNAAQGSANSADRSANANPNAAG